MPSEQPEEVLKVLERTLGYAFSDRALLETALTKPSFRTDHPSEIVKDNQRLEFLGDAVFGLLTAQRVFERYADEDEGGLTVRRSRMASARGLAELARKIGLGPYLRLGRCDETAGGRESDKALTDAMEAVFGAAWCDGGLPAVEAIFARLMTDWTESPENAWEENPKGGLQELAQRRAWPDSPVYELTGAEGPSHAPVYTVKARVAGGYEAFGTGKTKRAAESDAARALLRVLKTAGEA
jgi:ribonuclease-3